MGHETYLTMKRGRSRADAPTVALGGGAVEPAAGVVRRGAFSRGCYCPLVWRRSSLNPNACSVPSDMPT